MIGSEDDLRQRVISGVGWKLGSQLVVQASRTGIGILLAHLLSPRDYGLAAMALIFTGLASIFTDLSLGAALIQRESLSEQDCSTAFWTTIAAGASCMAIGVASAPLVARFFSTPAVAPFLAVASASFLLSAIASTQTALLTREMQFRSLQLREMAAVVTGGLTGLAVAIAGFGPWAIVVQALAAEAVAVVLVWSFSPWRPRLTYSLASLRDLGSFGGATAVARVLSYFNVNVDNLLIARYVGAAPLGVYAIAYSVMFAPLVRIATPIQQVLFPAFARLQGDVPRLGSAWLRGNRVVAAISVPAFMGMAVVAPDFVPTVLGGRWEGAVPILQLLCLAGAAQSLQSLNWSVLQARGQTTLLVGFMVFSTIVTVGSFVVGVHWGVVGVAAGFAVARVGVLPVFTWVACRTIEMPILAYVRSVRRVVETSLAMAVIVYAFRLLLVHQEVAAGARLALVVVAGAAVYLGPLLWREPELLAEARDLRPRRAQ